MKKIISIVSACLLALSLTGCNAQNETSERNFDSDINNSAVSVSGSVSGLESSTISIGNLEAGVVKMNPDWNSMLSRTPLNFLSEKEKTMYQRMVDSANEYLFSETDLQKKKSMGEEIGVCTVEFEDLLSEDETEEVLRVFFDNNPQFFFFDRRFSFIETGEKKVLYILCYKEFINGKERRQTVKEIYDDLKTIINSIDKNLSNSEKVELASDKICDICTPVEDVQYESSVYGVLKGKKASCAGYAGTFSLVMNGLGVDTIQCSSKSGEHIWNLSKIDEMYYVQDIGNLDKNPDARVIFINSDYGILNEDNLKDTPIEKNYTLDNSFAKNTRMLVHGNEIGELTIS